jgi:hypothetical protein
VHLTCNAGDSVEVEMLREQEMSSTLGAAREAGGGEMPPVLSRWTVVRRILLPLFYFGILRCGFPRFSLIYLLRARPRSRLLSLYSYLSIPSILNSLAYSRRRFYRLKHKAHEWHRLVRFRRAVQARVRTGREYECGVKAMQDDFACMRRDEARPAIAFCFPVPAKP